MLRILLRDDQWVRIKKCLQGKADDRERSGVNNRLFVEVVLSVTRTGSP
jgi:site-specific recombinase